MVKPHSPIAECKRSPHPTWDGHKTEDSTSDCSGGIFIRRRQEKNDAIASPREVTSAVTFSKIVKVQQVMHRNNMSEKVRLRYWLTEEDQIEIKALCRQTIFKMMRNEKDLDLDGSDFCSRGLEMRTKHGQREKVSRKEAARRAVLLQQKQQQDEGIFDAEFIALISAVKTKASSIAAREAALRDSEEALLYHMETP
jgi:hypothetical protein